MRIYITHSTLAEPSKHIYTCLPSCYSTTPQLGHGGPRGRVRASAPCPRDTHWHCRQWHRHTPTISPPGSWAPQLPRQSPPTTMERTATVVLFALFDSVPASGNVVGLYMLPLPPICIACYSSTSSVICTVLNLMAWHWQVLDARRWRMERRRRSARSGSNQTGQACSSTSTHGTEVRKKERKKKTLKTLN